MGGRQGNAETASRGHRRYDHWLIVKTGGKGDLPIGRRIAIGAIGQRHAIKPTIPLLGSTDAGVARVKDRNARGYDQDTDW